MKWCLAGLMALALGHIWSNRAPVVEAYTADTDQLDFQLEGLDLAVKIRPVDPSPYRVPQPVDTKAEVLPISFAASAPPPAPVGLAGGTSVLGGAIIGPDGPVEDAVIRIERHTLDGSATVDVLSDADGLWKAEGLVGGRYRVRAFVPGVVASESSTIFFLDDDTSRSIEVPTVFASSDPVVGFFAVPAETLIGEDVTVAVTVSVEAVDEEGRLTLSPAGPTGVTARVDGPMLLLSSDVVRTDPTGAGRFRLRCDGPSAAILTVSVEGRVTRFPLPPCVNELTPVEPEPDQSDPLESGATDE